MVSKKIIKIFNGIQIRSSKKNIKNNKKGITFNVLLMILMVILFVMIIIFGISKLHTLSNNLSQAEIQKYRNELLSSLEYCKNPLNKGSERVEIIKQSKIDMICLLGNDINNKFSTPISKTLEEIKKTKNNVVFLSNLQYNDVGEKKSISNAQIVATFNLEDFNSSKEETICFGKNSNNAIVLKITCK